LACWRSLSNKGYKRSAHEEYRKGTALCGKKNCLWRSAESCDLFEERRKPSGSPVRSCRSIRPYRASPQTARFVTRVQRSAKFWTSSPAFEPHEARKRPEVLERQRRSHLRSTPRDFINCFCKVSSDDERAAISQHQVSVQTYRRCLLRALEYTAGREGEGMDVGGEQGARRRQEEKRWMYVLFSPKAPTEEGFKTRYCGDVRTRR